MLFRLRFFHFGELLLVATAVGTYYFGSIQFRRGFVVATPSHFVVKYWLSGQTVPWDDVSSVTVESLKPRNSFSRGLTAAAFTVGSADMTFVKIGLRRSRVGRVPGILKVVAVYRWGVTGILKVMTLYLEEPEEFVEQAQQFMVMVPPPAMAASPGEQNAVRQRTLRRPCSRLKPMNAAPAAIAPPTMLTYSP